jgi:hypothetical protein
VLLGLRLVRLTQKYLTNKQSKRHDKPAGTSLIGKLTFFMHFFESSTFSSAISRRVTCGITPQDCLQTELDGVP